MKLIEKRIYFIYILLGSLYFISKVIYYTCGFVCLGGVMLGLVAYSALAGFHWTIIYSSLLSSSYDYSPGDSSIPIPGGEIYYTFDIRVPRDSATHSFRFNVQRVNIKAWN
jgi:hypothetical protein